MALSDFSAKINRHFKQEFISEPGTTKGHRVSRYSTGSLALDVATGGGFPFFRSVEVFGPESAGKSLLLNRCAATITNRPTHNKVLIVDAEGSFDEDWAKKCGCNVSNIEVARCDSGENELNIIELATASGEFALVGLDSIAAVSPKAELDSTMQENQMGVQARMLNKLHRKLYSAFNNAFRNDKPVGVIFINQLRHKIGAYGNPETTPGGMGTRYAVSIRVDLRLESHLKDEDDAIYGQVTKFFIPKNKIYTPLKKGSFTFHISGPHAGEVNNVAALFDMGIDYGFIEAGGAWYKSNWFPKAIQGRDNSVDYLSSLTIDELNAKVDELSTVLPFSGLDFKF